MKVLDLTCALGHRFEGWFASTDEFSSQRARGLVACPVCGSQQVSRLPSAPRLNLGAAKAPEESAMSGRAATTHASAAPATEAQLHDAMRTLAHELIARSEDVGDRFAAEARAIACGDAPARGIHGQATPQEAQALRDEGVEFFSLPWPGATH